jgi:hypothetical protein
MLRCVSQGLWNIRWHDLSNCEVITGLEVRMYGLYDANLIISTIREFAKYNLIKL